MKSIFIILTLFIFGGLQAASKLDSLQIELKKTKIDTSICSINSAMIKVLLIENQDSAEAMINRNILFCKNILKQEKDLTKAKRIKFHLANSFNYLGSVKKNQGALNEALELYTQALKLREELKNKSSLANSYSNIGIIYFYYDNYPKTLFYFNKYLELSSDIKDSIGISSALKNIGVVYDNLGKPDSAYVYFEKSYSISKRISDKAGMAASLNSMGIVLNDKGNVSESIDCYLKSLQLKEELHYTTGLASTYNNLGALFHSQREYKKALHYHRKSLFYSIESFDSIAIALSYTSMGVTLMELKQVDSALYYYNKSLAIYEHIQNKRGAASNLLNIGIIYFNNKKHKEAQSFYDKALIYYQESNHLHGICQVKNNLGGVNIETHNYKGALQHSAESYQMAMKLGYPVEMMNASANLSAAYKKLNNPGKSLFYLKKFVIMRDSINNEELSKANIQKEYQYQFDKKQLADSLLTVEKQKLSLTELDKTKAEIASKRIVKVFLIFSLIVAVGLILFVWNRFKLSKAQKGIIENQKNEVNEAYHQLKEKNKEVMDSIKYAARIQRSLITSEWYVKKHLNR